MQNLILIGGGGHCKSCIDVIELENKYNIIGILDVKEKIGQKILNYEIIGSDNDIDKFISPDTHFLISLGQIHNPRLRMSLFSLLVSLEAHMATVISPLSHVSKYAKIGKGTIIMHHVLVNANATVGDNCTINTKSLIEHDAVVKNNCHISTSAIVNGSTVVEEACFIGSNAVLANDITIKAYSFIKAGSVAK